MNDPHDQLEALLNQALEFKPAERAAFLAGACGNDHELRQKVETLLRAAAGAEGFMEAATRSEPPPGSEAPGTVIGHYKLLQKIGEGGFGTVYVAEQREPVKRRVALKIIKLGMDTRQVVARFEAERQALALMDHSNIAKVLDAGATETGRPYFIMELVRGIKITDYCDQHSLSTPQRLDLFLKVCQAIQHAHQKGIIHRDIKPSNILVTLHDGVPVPKVIDFGIAKATQGELTDKTIYTQFQQFIGTPAYMSPEQVEMSGLDIDTRSDIYSLGVLLYELLTGRTPFDANELMQSGLDAMRKTIREKEPLRPSTCLHTLQGEDLTTTAQHRGEEPPHLINILRGDLDWIVMKCLEKDRTRRYETASELTLDIHRHLTNEAVLARPPTRLYRLQKLIRRNKPVFAVLGTGVAALIVGLAAALYLLARERTERRRAVAAERAEMRLRQEAERRAEWSDKLTQAGLLLRRGQFDEAERLVGQVPPMPAMASFYMAFGTIHAQRGQWTAARTNFANVVAGTPADYMAYVFLAPLLVQTGDQEGYRLNREKMLRQFSDVSDPIIAERIAKACLILPSSPSELMAISKLADRAIAAGPQHPAWEYFQLAQGLAECRQGHFSNAVEWVQPLVDKKPWTRAVQARMVLAMAQHQLQQADQAGASLAQGLQMADSKLDKLSGGLDESWHDWIIARSLATEAKGLIGSSVRTTGTPP